ncbi:MAG: Ribonuclease 3 [Planctomycetota bacterium]
MRDPHVVQAELSAAAPSSAVTDPSPPDAGTAQANPASVAAPIDKLALCEDRIGYTFRDKQLLRNALTHASGAEHRLASNERLEFLGDSILGAVVCELLFRKYPDFLEGDLTRVKSVVVSRQTCAKISRVLGFDEFLIMGKGMACHASVPQSLLANVFESLVAAIFLDGGMAASHEFIKKYVGPEILLAVSGQSGDNYKSLLQQLAQKQHGTAPGYELLDEKGPDHSKSFKVRARLANQDFPPAWGRNKKEAEQRAACNALAAMNGETPPFLHE